MAQETKLKRKDLKQPDQFQTASGEFLAFFNRNKGLISGVLVAGVLVAGGTLFFSHQKTADQLRMESLYFEMSKAVQDNNLQGDQLISQLQSLYQQFKDGDQKMRAGLLLADNLYQNQKHDDAFGTFKSVRDSSQPGSLNHFLALSGMAQIFERKKDYPKAIEIYKSLTSQAGDFPLFYTYLGLARCYELSKDNKNAELILRDMQTKFPNHSSLEKVNQFLKRLEGQA